MVDVDEEQAEEEEGYDSSFYAEEKEDAKNKTILHRNHPTQWQQRA